MASWEVQHGWGYGIWRGVTRDPWGGWTTPGLHPALDYRCLLLPFYTGHYQYGGRLYDVLVHSQGSAGGGGGASATGHLGPNPVRLVFARNPQE